MGELLLTLQETCHLLKMSGLLLIVMKEMWVLLDLDEFLESSLMLIVVHDRLGVTESISIAFFNVCWSEEPFHTMVDYTVDIF